MIKGTFASSGLASLQNLTIMTLLIPLGGSDLKRDPIQTNGHRFSRARGPHPPHRSWSGAIRPGDKRGHREAKTKSSARHRGLGQPAQRRLRQLRNGPRENSRCVGTLTCWNGNGREALGNSGVNHLYKPLAVCLLSNPFLRSCLVQYQPGLICSTSAVSARN